jgi:hypothetical protein
MAKYTDYTGKRIGRINVLRSVQRKPVAKWECLCDCGRRFICQNASFKRGDTFECKECVLERRRGIDLTGKKFGRWSVLGRCINSLGKTVWRVVCECGNEGLVSTYALGRRGRSLSCGCLGRKEKSIRANTTLYPPMHGTSETRIYIMRSTILQACYNPEHPTYHRYGGRGVIVCDLWRNGAKDFYDWCIKNNVSSNRIIYLKDGCTVFSPENCEAIAHKEHQRRMLAKKITIKGETKNVFEWSEISGTSHHTILDRLKKGWGDEESVFRKKHRDSGKKKLPEDEIKNLYESGLTLADIAKHAGATYETISKRLKKMGVEIDHGCKRRKYSLKNCLICNQQYIPVSSRQKRCFSCKFIPNTQKSCLSYVYMAPSTDDHSQASASACPSANLHLIF